MFCSSKLDVCGNCEEEIHKKPNKEENKKIKKSGTKVENNNDNYNGILWLTAC